MMTIPTPEPLVPSCVDLQDFAFFPLDVVRLRDSMLAVEATGEEFRAAVLLWCASWHQVPAASLPDNDAALAKYAGYGRTEMDAWLKVREAALRGFVKCVDGRLYHRTLSEKACEAWDGKLRLRHKRECERIKKASARAHIIPLYPTFDEWKEHQIATGNDRWDPPSGYVPTPVPGTTKAMSPGMSPGTVEGRTQGQGGDVPGDSHPLKGQEIGTGDRGQETGDRGQGSKEQELPASLRSASSTAEPPTTDAAGSQVTGSGSLQAQKAEQERRLTAVTLDAMAAYNAILAKPNGLLPAVTEVGLDNKRSWVKRCRKVAREICARQYGEPLITRAFWDDYFGACDADEHKSGRAGGGKDHENWTPDFEYLTRPDVMIEVFDRIAGASEV
uniref:DUF1376 domain-containing protein n=1 Tax=Mycena chlorophos TaxID=658473 RepID=A0ABQ0KXN9_MYCCL|nr:predicted protein [Mycena chlorophos]